MGFSATTSVRVSKIRQAKNLREHEAFAKATSPGCFLFYTPVARSSGWQRPMPQVPHVVGYQAAGVAEASNIKAEGGAGKLFTQQEKRK